MQTNPILGLLYHAIGAASSSSCYTPQKKTTLWSFEAYWIATSTFAWLIFPVAVAFRTVPSFPEVVASVDPGVLWKTFIYGVIYGFGGLTFGLGIKYIGFSLNYAVAIGISAALGTLLPLFWTPTDGLDVIIGEKLASTSGKIVFAGIIISVVGIILCGMAGALREKLAKKDKTGQSNFKLGLTFAIMGGVLSAVFSIALAAGQPLEAPAVAQGTSELLKMNAIYPFAMGGAWVTNIIGCSFLFLRNRTGSQLFRLSEGGGGKLAFYYLMAALSGAFWYFQFFFYGIGHFYMGAEFGFTSWALHMAMLILFSNIYGFLFKEWAGADKRPKKIIHLGMAVIVIACVIIGYGNNLGEKEKLAAGEPVPETSGH
ncbi:MAG: L-rhamnose/proton symporter RhaT [Verrucomicrobiota bacterium]